MTPRQFKIGVSFRIRRGQSVPPGSMTPRSLAPFRDGIASLGSFGNHPFSSWRGPQARRHSEPAISLRTRYRRKGSVVREDGRQSDRVSVSSPKSRERRARDRGEDI